MSDEKEKGEYLKEVYLAKLRIDNICNSIIKCICDEFPKEERFLILGRVTNSLIDRVYKPIITYEESETIDKESKNE